MQIYNIRAEFIPVNFDIPAKLIDKTIQANGVYNASDDGADGYSSVTVVVPDRPLQIQELNVTPSTESQTIDVVSGIDGYGPVNVSAVENVLPENIKQGETILGVSGSVIESNETTLSVTPTTSAQSLTPTSPYTGFDEVNVSAVTSSIDANIQPQNIRENVTILGTTGTAYVPEMYIELGVNNNGMLTHPLRGRIIDFTGVKSLDQCVLASAYKDNINISGKIDMKDLTGPLDVYSCYMTFYKCSGITSVDLSSLTGIREDHSCCSMFERCNNLISVDLSSLTRIYGNYSTASMFNLCSNLTTVQMRALESIDTIGSARYAANGMFANCTSLTSIDLSSLTTVSGDYNCKQMFLADSALTTVDLRSLTTINGSYACEDMFKGCSSLTTVNLSGLKTIAGSSGRAFNGGFEGCTSLTGINLGSLETISGGYSCTDMFLGCTSLASANLGKLTSISGLQVCNNMFKDCTSLASVDLSSLTTVNGTGAMNSMFMNTGITGLTLHSLWNIYASGACNMMFKNCASLTSLSFPSLTPSSFGSYTNQFTNMLEGCSNVTVHFPSNIQTKIGSWADVTNGFGGTNTTVLFDLPATNTLTGADTVTYTRNPKYDTATALAWKVGAYGTTDFTPAYYTSGTTDPQVGDTIYSDDACTIAVTTIDSIA